MTACKKVHHDLPNQTVDFASVMAVAIHDMKNSLSLLMQSIEQVASNMPEGAELAMDRLTSVHYEANRMNTTLVQILSLYRSSIDALPINVDEVYVSDLLEEILDSNQTYTQQKNIKIICEVDPDLAWYFDRDLIYLMIYDVLINAIRYGCSQIRIEAFIEQDQLTLRLTDNGPGYPQAMLESSQSNLSSHAISEGRTGLGLFFARLIAHTHKNKDQRGDIILSNAAQGGSVFTLQLP